MKVKKSAKKSRFAQVVGDDEVIEIDANMSAASHTVPEDDVTKSTPKAGTAQTTSEVSACQKMPKAKASAPLLLLEAKSMK